MLSHLLEEKESRLCFQIVELLFRHFFFLLESNDRPHDVFMLENYASSRQTRQKRTQWTTNLFLIQQSLTQFRLAFCQGG